MGKPKRTHEQFVKEVYEILGEEYEVIGEYQTSKTKVKILHKPCGTIYEAFPCNILRGARCFQCYGKHRITPEEYRRRVKEVMGDEYEVLSDYVNQKTKIRVRHQKCGREYDQFPAALMRGNGCKYCANNQLKTHEEFLADLKQVHGEEYELLSTYERNKTKVVLKHNVCGNIIEMKPNNLLNGARCFHCHGAKRKTDEEFKEELQRLTNGEYEALDEYQNAHHKIRMKHLVCGGINEITPHAFINKGSRCPYCSNQKVLAGYNDLATTHPNIAKTWVQDKNGSATPEQYSYGSNKEMWWRCECGHEWKLSIKQRVTNKYCPSCSQTRGEMEVAECLERHQLIYQPQYRIEECRSKAPLPFDVAVLGEAGRVRCLIEFDGEQHFYPIKAFGGKKGFERTKKHDEIRNQYCKDNKIVLIRIPYWLRGYVDEVLTYWLKHYEMIE